MENAGKLQKLIEKIHKEIINKVQVSKRNVKASKRKQVNLNRKIRKINNFNKK